MTTNPDNPLFDKIFRQMDEGPIGSRTKCCAVLNYTRRVSFIFPLDANSTNPRILSGGWISQNVHSELGWHPDEIVNGLLDQFIHPDDRHWILTRDVDLVKLRVRRKDAGFCWVIGEGTMSTDALFGSFKILRSPIRGLGTDSGHSFSIEK